MSGRSIERSMPTLEIAASGPGTTWEAISAERVALEEKLIRANEEIRTLRRELEAARASAHFYPRA